jgi:hypothetical protein
MKLMLYLINANVVRVAFILDLNAMVVVGWIVMIKGHSMYCYFLEKKECGNVLRLCGVYRDGRADLNGGDSKRCFDSTIRWQKHD